MKHALSKTAFQGAWQKINIDTKFDQGFAEFVETELKQNNLNKS